VYKVTKELSFCYGHRLLDYQGKCRHLHGHNAKVEIELAAEALDQTGMIFDFGDVERVIQTWLDKELDHKMILRKDDPLLKPLQEAKEPCYAVEVNPTAETLAKLIFDYAVSQGLSVTAVKFWENPTSFATYTR